MVDDVPVKGMRLLSNVYQRCSIVVCEPTNYEEAIKNQNWMIAMKEELSMIEKNKTWILVERPKDRKGFVKEGEEEKVYLLKKALYGLKQAPRARYSRIDEHLLNLGFAKRLYESTLYVKHNGVGILIISLYVDDLLVTGNYASLVEKFKLEMIEVFEMTNLGLMTFFLGMEIKQSEHEVLICQKKYAKEILKKFKLDECKEIRTPMNPKDKLSKDDGTSKIDQTYFRNMIGCLMYLIATRFDILNVPDNVLDFSDGDFGNVVKIVDLGLARRIEEQEVHGVNSEAHQSSGADPN
ncbi:Retrovirus-related Pol polyprotein from transposon RE1 [Vitis vinifera]|uniref:Retrovirus-related Pol polyprotein from transposon RE1 n=1 Tax=Vitis vinifera TaxID=29760 RepID=A0A438HY45_VITVI|nr:Retrovirus-related Pol polyprotein from transposon RE1 [Vitis vinifera]